MFNFFFFFFFLFPRLEVHSICHSKTQKTQWNENSNQYFNNFNTIIHSVNTRACWWVWELEYRWDFHLYVFVWELATTRRGGISNLKALKMFIYMLWIPENHLVLLAADSWSIITESLWHHANNRHIWADLHCGQGWNCETCLVLLVIFQPYWWLYTKKWWSYLSDISAVLILCTALLCFGLWQTKIHPTATSHRWSS